MAGAVTRRPGFILVDTGHSPTTTIPADIIEKTRRRHADAHELLTGHAAA